MSAGSSRAKKRSELPAGAACQVRTGSKSQGGKKPGIEVPPTRLSGADEVIE
jgi:hypothetical protein